MMNEKEEDIMTPESSDEMPSEQSTGDMAEETMEDTPADDDKQEEQPGNEDDEELQTKYMRLAADFQNFKNRAQRERAAIYQTANEGIVTKLLDVIDNFERALQDETADADQGFKEGMQMIKAQLDEVLKKSGVEEIESDGAQFDPNYHNAMMMEDCEGAESGCITEVLQKGYTLNGKVIRPAMVKVAN